MVAEGTQHLGLEGALAVKTWLESTTYLELPFNAYEDEPMCTLMLRDGSRKRYDLLGHFLDERRPVVVESKRYTTPGHQGNDFTEFLANAYSATSHDLVTVGDVRREYIWVTTHPFSQTKWKGLTQPDEMRAALKTHSQLLAGEEIDEDRLRLVVSRLWLLVMHEKQKKLMLNRSELQLVRTVLDRKATS
ncbi:hypothetical protein [Actinomadura napierensis]